MKKRTRNAIVAAAAVFAALFALRLASELAGGSKAAVGNDFRGYALNQESSARLSKLNYASEKIFVPQGGGQQVVDQKYEKVADIRTASKDFDADDKRIRGIAAAASAVIQSENAYGLPGSRVLSLRLGVVPESFEKIAEELRGVGKLLSITVTKTDKTGDFKALEAKRLSLEKTRDGLKALRTAGAELADRISLETKILEIEGQIQELGVSLGDFSESNSFCTIDVALSESTSPGAGYFLAKVLDALGWALLVEAGIAFVLLAAAGVAALAALAFERYRKARVAQP